MTDKYLSIITNFGCHYSCPECIVRNNKLKMTPTEEYSSYMQLEHVLKNECNDCNWVSVSGGGETHCITGGNIRRGGQDSFRCVKNLVARLSYIRAIMILIMMMEF